MEDLIVDTKYVKGRIYKLTITDVLPDLPGNNNLA